GEVAARLIQLRLQQARIDLRDHLPRAHAAAGLECDRLQLATHPRLHGDGGIRLGATDHLQREIEVAALRQRDLYRNRGGRFHRGRCVAAAQPAVQHQADDGQHRDDQHEFLPGFVLHDFSGHGGRWRGDRIVLMQCCHVMSGWHQAIQPRRNARPTDPLTVMTYSAPSCRHDDRDRWHMTAAPNPPETGYLPRSGAVSAASSACRFSLMRSSTPSAWRSSSYSMPRLASLRRSRAISSMSPTITRACSVT